MKYPPDMDAECIEICDEMNKISSLETISSCCGHGEKPFRIFFVTKSFGSLTALCYAADACHSGAVGWKVIAITDCSMAKNRFMLEGPIGDYMGAAKIAAAIRKL